MQGSRKWVLRLLGVVLFALVLTRVDAGATWAVLARGRWEFFFPTLLLFVVNIAVKTWRWHLLLRDQDIDVPVGGLFAAYLGSFHIGLVTPGRLGELIKVFYLKDIGYSMAHSLVGTIVDRACDIIMVAAWGCVGIWFYAAVFRQALVILSMLVGGGVLVFGILWWQIDWRERLLRAMFQHLVPARFYQITLKAEEFYHEYRRLRKRTLLKALLLSMLSWLIYFGQVYLLALALGIEITFLYLSVFIAISSLLSLLPITLSGIGTRDAALVYLFGTVGLPGESALALSLLILAMMVANGGISLIAWLRGPVRVG